MNFVREEDALKCLRILNNHPDVFFKDKRPIVEFAVENSKALKILSDRVERNRKKLELRRQIDNTGDQLQAEPDKKKKRLRPWQIAKEERKKKRRLAQRFFTYFLNHLFSRNEGRKNNFLEKRKSIFITALDFNKLKF